MRYLVATVTIALVAFGFVSFASTPSHAWSRYDQCRANGKTIDDCRQYVEQVDELESLEFADKEDGASDEDGGESSDGDFGEGDRAAASAEEGQDQ